jgi:hypothetical protein
VFKCPFCQESVGPRVKPVTVVSAFRAMSYVNVVTSLDEFERETKKVVNSVGTEIVREAHSCAKCAGEPIVDRPVTTIRKGGPVCEEQLPPPIHLKFAAVAAYNALCRTEHKSRRARMECEKTIPVIKQFIDNNTKFIF